MFITCETHDGCCRRDSWQASVPIHLPARLKHCLVSQNVLSKNAARQKAEGMGHFKLVGSYRPRRRLQYQKAVAESPSKSHKSLPPWSLPKHVQLYTDTSLAFLDSTLRPIPLLPPPSHMLPLRPNQVCVSGAEYYAFSRLILYEPSQAS